MTAWSRVCKRLRILWQDGDYRMLRHFVVYCGEDEWGTPYEEPKVYWFIEKRLSDDPDGYHDPWGNWQKIKEFSESSYIWAAGYLRRRITIEMAYKGKLWLERHKQLLDAPAWVIRCLNIDGQGTICPIYQQQTETCGVNFYWMGYGGSPACRPAPGVCDAPNYEGACLPTKGDKHGNSLGYYQKILRSKNERD